MNINYPSGYGPDDSLQLDVENVAVVDIFPGYAAHFNPGFKVSEDAWECVICVYSLQSGSKIMQFGNYRRYSKGMYVKNMSPNTLSFLIGSWHKKSIPNENEPWSQTGKLKALYKIDTESNSKETIFLFNGYGELKDSPYIQSGMGFALAEIKAP
ncbi:hypothetical protein [Bacillus subtilis]|uniref:hypothetical protein n=1 Tax=Bacillus subtilis TaxID=1423 RepID=UPI002A6A45AE|nr:hypothetical protein [Bacillus subtilis]WPP26256.1 hypothetical protein SIS06_03500 [Bacillus subtilis]